jgi:RHS repeat-associated protein
MTSTNTYDRAKRVLTVVHAKGVTNRSRTTYEYDGNGNRLRETINRDAGAQVTRYTYDRADRLTETSVVDAAKTVTTGYTLDAVANRTEEKITTTKAGATTVASKGYVYDGRNQLTAITDAVAGNTVLNYDSQGNLTGKTQGNDLTTYKYNARDNLIEFARNGTVLGRYGNDHLGLRVEKEAKDPLQPNAPPVRLRTLWDGRSAFQDSDTSGAVMTRYESDGRRPVSMWSRDDGIQSLHHDALGSVIATTDSNGALKSETIYDAFGNVQESTGQSANKFGYTGHQMDQESGLIYFQARYYDPQIGRFITQDPFEGDWKTPLSLHHYLYAYGNPTTYVDLNGYKSISANIDDAAEGCGAWSCAGYALLKGAYVASTFGFSVVHDPVRDQYDEGKITGGQYAARGIGGGAAMVAVNTAGVALGGVSGGVGATLAGTVARGSAVGAATAGANDAAVQGVNMAAGLQKKYNGTQTATAMAVGGAFGGVVPAAAAGLNTQTGKAITNAVSSTVKKTAQTVASAVQSVRNGVKGVVTQEGRTLGADGARIGGKSVAAEQTVGANSSAKTAPSVPVSVADKIDGPVHKTVSEMNFPPGNLKFSDSMSSDQYKKLLKSIEANGIQNKVITYVEIEGLDYIAIGNNRYMAAQRTGALDQLRFQKSDFPVPGTNWYTAQDILDASGTVKMPKIYPKK